MSINWFLFHKIFTLSGDIYSQNKVMRTFVFMPQEQTNGLGKRQLRHSNLSSMFPLWIDSTVFALIITQFQNKIRFKSLPTWALNTCISNCHFINKDLIYIQVALLFSVHMLRRIRILKGKKSNLYKIEKCKRLNIKNRPAMLFTNCAHQFSLYNAQTKLRNGNML